ncbi:kinase, partial [Enterobacter hormaechei subsp. xiangfangensis]
QWWLVNEGISGLMSLPDKRQIMVGEKIELKNNAQFVLSKEEGGRLVVVQLVEN